MKIFLDTEFIERKDYLQLISIALVAESGEKYYAVCDEYKEDDCSVWVKENVLPVLGVKECAQLCPQPKSRNKIRDEIITFVRRVTDKPQFCGYYSAYDHVLFCWLFGAMIDLPEGYPMYCWDLRQFLDDNMVPEEIKVENPYEHNALYDCIYELESYNRALEWIQSQQDPFQSFLAVD